MKRKIRNIELLPINKTSYSYWRNTRETKPTISALDLERMREIYNKCNNTIGDVEKQFIELLR